MSSCLIEFSFVFYNIRYKSSHFTGTGLEFSVVQQTSCPSAPEFQTRDEQSQIIEKNLHYDFNFQQANHLNREIIVRPVRHSSTFTLFLIFSILLTIIIGWYHAAELLLQQYSENWNYTCKWKYIIYILDSKIYYISPNYSKGGESTQDEMCLSFPVYYPKIAMSQCTSQPTFENVSSFIDNYVP